MIHGKKTNTLNNFLIHPQYSPVHIIDKLVRGCIVSLNQEGTLQLSSATINTEHQWVGSKKSGITNCELVRIKKNQEAELYLRIENKNTRTLGLIKDRWSPRSQSIDSSKRSVALSIEDRIRWFKKPSITPWVDHSDGSYQVDNFRVGSPSSQLDSRVLITEQRWAITLINYGSSSEGKQKNYGHAALLIESLYQNKLGMLLCHLTGNFGMAQKNIVSNNAGTTFVNLLREKTNQEVIANIIEEPLDPQRLWRKIEGKNSTYQISHTQAKKLMQEILYGNRPLFSFLGSPIWCHNCLTWAKCMASEVNIDFQRLTPWSVMNYPIYFTKKINTKHNYMLPLELEIPKIADPLQQPQNIEESKVVKPELDEDILEIINGSEIHQPTMEETEERQNAHSSYSGYSENIRKCLIKSKEHSVNFKKNHHNYYN